MNDNITIWRVYLIINNDPCQRLLTVDFASVEKAVEYWFNVIHERVDGQPKFTVCGPVPIGNLTFSES